MGNINLGRVILGGLAAGFVMNAIEMAAGSLFGMEKKWTDALQALGKTMTPDPMIFAGFIGLWFAMGICCAWLYAAIRPRFGAGPKTAVISGIAIWLFAIVLPQVVNLLLSIYPTSTILTFEAITFVEFVGGTLLAAWIYKESGASRSASA